MSVPVRNEQGAALVYAVLFLMLLTAIVAVLHRTTLFEILLSRNYQESKKALYAAESGVRVGLQRLEEEVAQGGPPQDPNPGFSAYAENAEGCRYRYRVVYLKRELSPDSSDIYDYYYRIEAEGQDRAHTITRATGVVRRLTY